MISQDNSRDRNLIKYYLRATFLRVEGQEVVITLEGGQEIKWPKVKLPVNLKIGESFYLVATQEISLEKQKQEIARAILEEILNG